VKGKTSKSPCKQCVTWRARDHFRCNVWRRFSWTSDSDQFDGC